MLERFFPTIKLPLSCHQFHQLPQNPAYKYEYSEETAWLSPRPKFYSAHLALHAGAVALPDEVDAQEAIGFRRFEDGDWHGLSSLFASAFHRVQPFASLSDRRRLECARACLKHTREGGDGPVIKRACHVAFSRDGGHRRGAILVTLIPMVDLSEIWSMRWKTPPPADCIEQQLGRPHLTWIFVGPWQAGNGIGTALLAHASQSLLELGYTELVSSFILGNTSSMLWHWRNGFELLPYIGSTRRMRDRIKERDSSAQGSI